MPRPRHNPSPKARARRRPPPRTRPAGPWKHGPIPVIGVVGGIGSGKSAVAERLGALGGFVIDADKVGHALLDQEPARSRLIERFGPEIVVTHPEDGSPGPIDRPSLGRIVFADPKARRDLEAIVHPRMRQTFEKAIARVIRRGESAAVVLDAAVLYEAGWDALCDRVVFVDAPRDVRLERLRASRGWTAERLDAREAAQRPLAEKQAAAEWTIPNAGGAEALDAAVAEVWAKILRSAPRRNPTPRPTPPGAGSGPPGSGGGPRAPGGRRGGPSRPGG